MSLHARLIEAQPDGSWIALAGDQQISVSVSGGHEELRRGDLVEVALEGEGYRVLKKEGGPSAAFDGEGDATRFRGLQKKPSRMVHLWKRQAVLRAVREYFYREGFLEVQCPLLIKGTCPDAFLDSIEVPGYGYLTTSVEYQIKRLWVGGFRNLFSLTQNFRKEPMDETHSPEFTMLEWGRTYATLEEIDRDAEELVKSAWKAVNPLGGPCLFRGYTIDLLAPWERITLREALHQAFGIQVDEGFSLAVLEAEVDRVGCQIPKALRGDQGLMVSYLVDAMQEKLGRTVPVFVHDWPLFQTSSAGEKEGVVGVAERSELYIGGVEIADGFPAMRDLERQQALFEQQQTERRGQGKPPVILDQRYLAALSQGLPPAAGMALGFDRLVMVLTGASDIRDVLTFAWDEV